MQDKDTGLDSSGGEAGPSQQTKPPSLRAGSRNASFEAGKWRQVPHHPRRGNGQGSPFRAAWTRASCRASA